MQVWFDRIAQPGKRKNSPNLARPNAKNKTLLKEFWSVSIYEITLGVVISLWRWRNRKWWSVWSAAGLLKFSRSIVVETLLKWCWCATIVLMLRIIFSRALSRSPTVVLRYGIFFPCACRMTVMQWKMRVVWTKITRWSWGKGKKKGESSMAVALHCGCSAWKERQRVGEKRQRTANQVFSWIK
jgi:hypothetical protein